MNRSLILLPMLIALMALSPKPATQPLKSSPGKSPTTAPTSAPASTISGDLLKLQGVWSVSKAFEAGHPAPADWAQAMRITIKGDHLTLVFNRDDVEESTISLNEQSSPHRIDMHSSLGGHISQSLGIYEVDGDNAKLAWCKPGERRPKDFDSPDQWKATMVVMKRISKSK